VSTDKENGSSDDEEEFDGKPSRYPSPIPIPSPTPPYPSLPLTLALP